MQINLWTTSDNTDISRGTGNFDDWHITVNNKTIYDRQYFQQLKNLAIRYSNQKVYDDFVTVYDSTDFEVNNEVFENIIPRIANTYQSKDYNEVENLFSILYAVMLAEQKRPLPLKKKIKRLGIYQVLFLNYSPVIASKYSYKANKPQILTDVHNLICTHKEKNLYCQNINHCIYGEERPAKLLNMLCNYYGF